MPSSLYPASIWLVPGAADRSRLGGEVARLASEFGAPRFAPHVTLYAGHATRATEDPLIWQSLLTDLAANLAPLQVEVGGVGHSADLFKTLFLELDLAPELRSLERRVRAELPLADGYVFAPHLSLLYRELPLTERERLSRLVVKPPSLHFDALALVTPGPGGWRDIADWREVLGCPLGTALSSTSAGSASE